MRSAAGTAARAARVGLLGLVTAAAGCQRGEAGAAGTPAARETGAPAGLDAGRYRLASADHFDYAGGTRPDGTTLPPLLPFRGATLELAGPTGGQQHATLALPGADTAPDARRDGSDTYDGYFTPGASKTRVRVALVCHCRVATDAFGQPAYSETTVGGEFRVTPLGGGRFELRAVDYKGKEAAQTDTLVRL